MLAAGQPDLIFGVGGETVISTPDSDATELREVLDLGAAGTLIRTDDGLTRLDIAGRPDTGFSGDGFFRTLENVNDVDVLVGVDRAALFTDFGLRQIDGSGDVIAAYGGGDGLASFPAGVEPERIVGDVSANVYLVGIRTDTGFDAVTVTRYDANGNIAGAFGTLNVTTFVDGIEVLDAFGGDGGNLFIVTKADIGASFVYSVVVVSPTGSNTAANFATINKAQGIELTYAGGGVLANGDPRVVYTNGESYFFADPFDNDTVELANATDFVTRPVAGYPGASVDSGGRVTLFGERVGEALGFGAARFDDTGAIDLGYANGGYVELAGQPLAANEGGVLTFAPDDNDVALQRITGGSSRALPGPVWMGFADGKLRVDGTDDGDAIRVTLKPDGSRFVVRANGEIRSFPTSGGRSIDVLSKGGDDLIELGASNDFGLFADGADGNDTIRGGIADDVLLGGAGDDFVYGILGRDNLFGGAGNDFLFGGNDRDYLEGGAGNDSLNGNAQNDTLLGNGGFDTLNGAGGTDSAVEDDLDDLYLSVEVLL